MCADKHTNMRPRIREQEHGSTFGCWSCVCRQRLHFRIFHFSLCLTAIEHDGDNRKRTHNFVALDICFFSSSVSARILFPYRFFKNEFEEKKKLRKNRRIFFDSLQTFFYFFVVLSLCIRSVKHVFIIAECILSLLRIRENTRLSVQPSFETNNAHV